MTEKHSEGGAEEPLVQIPLNGAHKLKLDRVQEAQRDAYGNLLKNPVVT